MSLWAELDSRVRLAAGVVVLLLIGALSALLGAVESAPVRQVVQELPPSQVLRELPRLATAAPATAEPGAFPIPAALISVDPVEAGLDPRRLRQAEQAVRAEVRRGAFPGAALAVGRGDRLVLLEGIGHTAWNGRAVDPEATVYDLASLTKVVAATTAVMLLVEDGRMDLDAPVSRYLPTFTQGDKRRVTIRHLLTHTSGLPAWAELSGRNADHSLSRALSTSLKNPVGQRVEYSDVGFVILWAAAASAAGEPLNELLGRRLFAPLGMAATAFAPGSGCGTCAPTIRRSDGSTVAGLVHDPIARKLGGVTGNAGLFATAQDLARFAAMLANEGELDGVRVLQQSTIREFTRRQPGAGTRALGWDTPGARGAGGAGTGISRTAYGHTGFTGTSLWIDPQRKTWVVLLTNRTFAPRAPNRIQTLRRTVNDRVAVATASQPARGLGE